MREEQDSDPANLRVMLNQRESYTNKLYWEIVSPCGKVVKIQLAHWGRLEVKDQILFCVRKRVVPSVPFQIVLPVKS